MLELITVLQWLQIDAGFATYESMEQFVGFGGVLQKLPQEFACMIDGNALMTRKDSPFVSLWDEGFKKIGSNGAFRKLCEKGNRHHGEFMNLIRIYSDNHIITMRNRKII